MLTNLDSPSNAIFRTGVPVIPASFNPPGFIAVSGLLFFPENLQSSKPAEKKLSVCSGKAKLHGVRRLMDVKGLCEGNINPAP